MNSGETGTPGKNKKISGRGSAINTDNRFERHSYRESDASFEYRQEAYPENFGRDGFDPTNPGNPGGNFEDGSEINPRTKFFRDNSRTIITHNNSPDVSFDSSVNAYRGCEHGCAYCYARPTHEYLGLSAGLDFESKIIVKENAPALLREELMSKKWQPQVLVMSGVTDCYQPIERKLRLTRGCLEVMAEFRNPVALITKNHLITRDKDILADLARDNAARTFISITTLDAELCGVLEPRTSRPQFRLQAIRELAEAGIPVGVNVAPVIPGLNDHEIPAILKAAREAGAEFAGYTLLRLPLSVRPIFEEWVRVHRPDRADKIIHQIQDVRGGRAGAAKSEESVRMNDARFGSRMRGEGVLADQLRQLFKLHCRREGFNQRDFELSTAAFKRPPEEKPASPQLDLFQIE
jgi:DNA repair photolyase